MQHAARLVSALLTLGAVTAAGRAQAIEAPTSLRPGSNELNAGNPVPWMHGASRVQQFLEAAELGTTAFRVRALAFRFDGPTGGNAGRHTVGRVTLRLGVTDRTVATLDSRFGDNLTRPLTTAFAAQRLSFVADGRRVAGPEPWGSGGVLRLPLTAPVAVSLPTTGAFAIELLVQNNANALVDLAALDFAVDPANAQSPGAVATDGKGCPPGPNAPRTVLETTGRYEPGASFSVHGSGYTPNAPVATLLTAKVLGTPLALPGTTPICWLYLDTTTGLALALASTDGGGDVPPFGGDNAIPLPKGPRMCGAVLYVQNVTPGKTWSGNTLGLNTSNYRTIVVGCPKKPTVRAWHASHHRSATAAVASAALYGSYALRIE